MLIVIFFPVNLACKKALEQITKTLYKQTKEFDQTQRRFIGFISTKMFKGYGKFNFRGLATNNSYFPIKTLSVESLIENALFIQPKIKS